MTLHHLWHVLSPNPAFRWDSAKTNWTAVRWFLLFEFAWYLLIETFDHWFSHWSAAGSALVSFGVFFIIFRPNEATGFVMTMSLLVLLFLPGKKSS